MSSRISLRNLLRKEIRQMLWLPALISVIAVFLYPVRYLLKLQMVNDEAFLHAMRYDYDRSGWIRKCTEEILGRSDVVTAVALIIAGILCAVVAFSWIDQCEKVDLFHALSLQRKELFRNTFLCGWLSAAVPYVVCVLLAYLCIGASYGAVTVPVTGKVAAGVGLHLLGFTAVYAVAVLAMQLTGRILIGLLMSLFLLGYGPACYLIFWNSVSIGFTTWWNTGGDYTLPVRMLSPVIDIVGMAERQEGSILSEILILAVWMAAAVFAALQLYRRRPSETAENAMCSPRLERLIKVAVMIPGALGIGMILHESGDSTGNGWLIAGTLLGAVLLHGAMEFIYTPDLKRVMCHWRSGLVGIGTVAVLLVILVADPFRYDRWLPEQEKIEAMAMTVPEQSWHYGSVAMIRQDLLRGILPEYATEEFGEMYALASAGVESAMRRHGGGVSVGTAEALYDVIVYFCLKDGEEVFRRYQVPVSTVLAAEDVLVRDAHQRELLYPVHQLRMDNVRDYRMDRWIKADEEGGEPNYQSVALHLSEAEIRELTACLQRDAERAGVREILTRGTGTEEMILDLEPVYADESLRDQNGPYTIGSFYVYADDTETLNWLQDRGVEDLPV